MLGNWIRQDRMFDAVRTRDGKVFKAIKDVNGKIHVFAKNNKTKKYSHAQFIRHYCSKNFYNNKKLLETGHA